MRKDIFEEHYRMLRTAELQGPHGIGSCDSSLLLHSQDHEFTCTLVPRSQTIKLIIGYLAIINPPISNVLLLV